MGASSALRAEDWRMLIRLVGECRELGDEPHLWRAHFAQQVGRRVGGDLCYFGELAGCDIQKPKDLGVAEWGWDAGFDRTSWLPMLRDLRDKTSVPITVTSYLGKLRVEDGVSLTRSGFLTEREWSRSIDARISDAIGTNHAVFCFHSIPGAAGVHSALQFHRAAGHRDFGRRDVAFVRESHAALIALVGGPLARFTEPSPRNLPVRVRQVLACLLEGDGDKQIAVRLGLSVYTVNEYTKIIFRHFHVRSRPELLARWIRRGHALRSGWVED
jgi:DNA-binding NarL/FixJ family response regulator